MHTSQLLSTNNFPQSIHRFTLIDCVKCMSMQSGVSKKCIFSTQIVAINFLARYYTVNILEIDDHRCFDVMESIFASGLLWPTEVLSPIIICSGKFTSAHLKTEKNFPYTGICILHSVILGRDFPLSQLSWTTNFGRWSSTVLSWSLLPLASQIKTSMRTMLLSVIDKHGHFTPCLILTLLPLTCFLLITRPLSTSK